MLKNIIFDFGNVIMNYNPDEILNHYELRPADHDLLRKTIFESKEWSEIDAGKITEKEATEIFIDRVPDQLKSKVKQIMATWPENVDFYEPVFNYMENCVKMVIRSMVCLTQGCNLLILSRIRKWGIISMVMFSLLKRS